MEPLDLTVYDKNIRYTLSHGDQSSTHQTPDDGLNAMFPTNIKYIFEEDADNVELAVADETIENVIIIYLGESGALEDVEVISDRYELLGFRKRTLGTNNEAETYDIELDVLSEFSDLSTIASELSLNDLIKLYTTQNEQLQAISNSI
ncbi:hypothetical protein HG535_0C01880 [Zygotorulaspora mrakii]|uniref:Uncharacterized protein n=1 Tax=Zygotorulaspora mrakii TaxID=42260 RepID=A0A7H9B1J4_ZYGMR|nr:uncharacterized protein HG535_0C01880 [Zygotorulaspora mrakii]QLG71839.1 hypothetical protein HG535_0C01880 [Zygotorulaspora mrakii]